MNFLKILINCPKLYHHHFLKKIRFSKILKCCEIIYLAVIFYSWFSKLMKCQNPRNYFTSLYFQFSNPKAGKYYCQATISNLALLSLTNKRYSGFYQNRKKRSINESLFFLYFIVSWSTSTVFTCLIYLFTLKKSITHSSFKAIAENLEAWKHGRGGVLLLQSCIWSQTLNRWAALLFEQVIKETHHFQAQQFLRGF